MTTRSKLVILIALLFGGMLIEHAKDLRNEDTQSPLKAELIETANSF